MKADILVPLAEDWSQEQGYFTHTNLKLEPFLAHKNYVKKKGSVASAIDLLEVNSHRLGPERIAVVTRKSWQEGFDLAGIPEALRRAAHR